jgi:hypothetical protein
MTVRVPWMSAPDGPKRLNNANTLEVTAHAVRLNPNFVRSASSTAWRLGWQELPRPPLSPSLNTAKLVDVKPGLSKHHPSLKTEVPAHKPGSESRNYLQCVISDALCVFHDDVFNDSV